LVRRKKINFRGIKRGRPLEGWCQESFLNNHESLEEFVTVDGLEAALKQFREIAADLGAGEGVEIEKS